MHFVSELVLVRWSVFDELIGLKSFVPGKLYVCEDVCVCVNVWSVRKTCGVDNMKLTRCLGRLQMNGDG